MLPSLLPLLAGDGPRYGEIPHLAKDEMVVVTETGGGRFHQARLAVSNDGTVTYKSVLDRKPERSFRWRLTSGELGALRLLIMRTDFTALHQAPQARFPPSAVDANDVGVAVRQNAAVRGWSNTLWTEPETPLPLFVRLQELEDQGRRNLDAPSRRAVNGIAENKRLPLTHPS